MGFLRSVYDALAIIGAAVIAWIVIVGGTAAVKDWLRPPRAVVENPATQRAVERRQARVAAAGPQPAPEPPSPLGLPMGLQEAQTRGLAESAQPRLYLQIDGRIIPGARRSWVERHARDLYLLATSDSYIAQPRAMGSRWALRLNDGELIAVQHSRGDAGVTYAYAALCAPPADSLLVVTVARDQQLPKQSRRCKS